MKTAKRITLVVLAFALLVSAVVGMVACNKFTNPVQMTETEIIVPLDAEVMPDISGKHLKDYLDALQEKECLTYEAQGGMIYTINGRTADASQGEYWLIYSDDPDYSNEAWGTYVVGDTTYKSTTLGYESLPLTEGKTYVFMISKFDY